MTHILKSGSSLIFLENRNYTFHHKIDNCNTLYHVDKDTHNNYTDVYELSKTVPSNFNDARQFI